jgi:hypothetical protein
MSALSAKGRLLALPGEVETSVGWACAVLSWSGYPVDHAEDAPTALRMLRSGGYEVLVLGYSSSQADVQLSVDLLQDPEARLATLVILVDEDEFITPPQTHFVPTAFLEPGFSQAELLRSVEELRKFKK